MQITVQQLADLLRERGAQNAIVFPNGQIRIITQWTARNFQLSTEPEPSSADSLSAVSPTASRQPQQPQPLNPA